MTPALGSKAGDVVIRNALDVDNCDCFDNTNGWVAKADHPPTFSKGKGLSANTFSWSLNDASSQQGSPFINCEYDLLTRSHHCTSKNVDGVTCSGHVKFQAKYVKPRKTVSITGDEQ